MSYTSKRVHVSPETHEALKLLKLRVNRAAPAGAKLTLEGLIAKLVADYGECLVNGDKPPEKPPGPKEKAAPPKVAAIWREF